jgi:glycosyltransferase involved in cell wall biosynthesis
MSEAATDATGSTVPARLQDRLWYDAADAVRAGLRPGDLVLAHDDFRRVLPNVVNYEARRRTLDARIDHFVLHKGLLADLDPGYLAEAVQLMPRFANEVFVVLSREDCALPSEQRCHLTSLYESARALLDDPAGTDASPSSVVEHRSPAQSSSDDTAIHLVSALPYLEGGTEQHAVGLYDLLARYAEVSVWSVCASTSAMSRRVPVQRLDEREGSFPRGGTIALLGTHWRIGPWIERSRAHRVVLILTTDESDRLVRRMQELAAYGIGVEVSCVSGGLLSRSGAYGSVGLPPVDLTRFHPAKQTDDHRFVVGRMSRDDSSKHHPDDVNVYRRLVEAGCVVRIMGGSSIAQAWTSTTAMSANHDAFQVQSTGAVDPAEFLRELSCFYYRTGFRLDGARLYEAGGLVIAEALACGIPVVAERFGGYVDWVEHGRSGFLFDEPDEAVEYVVQLANDPELLRRMRQAARARAEELFGIHEMSRLLELFGIAAP